MLPCVGADDPHAHEWAIRRESYQHLQRSAAAGSLHVLDLGAGNGWLSNRLAEHGHHAVAVDWLDDVEDGLGACCHYRTAFACVQADFDALPFAPGQFDLVVFNGSLHYSPDVAATLARARLMLAPGGRLVVMDSPMFRDEPDGEAMVADKLRRFKTQYGLSELVHPNVGFLTFARMSHAFARLGLHGRFTPSRGSLGWRARRELARIRLRRAPAAFGVWITQPAATAAPAATPAREASASGSPEPERPGVGPRPQWMMRAPREIK